MKGREERRKLPAGLATPAGDHGHVHVLARGAVHDSCGISAAGAFCSTVDGVRNGQMKVGSRVRGRRYEREA